MESETTQPEPHSSSPRKSDPVDEHVGKRIRFRRLMLSISQMALAELLGITFQQVQKYENGVNRISAGRLYRLSILLGVPIQFFFDDLPASPLLEESGKIPAPQIPINLLFTKELIDAMAGLANISDAGLRRTLIDHIITLSEYQRPPA